MPPSTRLTQDAEIPRESGVFFSRISRGNLAHWGALEGNNGQYGLKKGVLTGFLALALSLLKKGQMSEHRIRGQFSASSIAKITQVL
jgi:hypothetical protein